MAENKILNTRIKLKYDTLQAWNDSSLVLGAGELAIATVDTVEGSTLQPVMIKVGDGSKTFSQLDFISAKAADVYGWAKEDLSAFNTRVNNLINGALNGEGAATIKGYVTEADFNEFKTTLEQRLLGIEADVKAIKDDYTTAAQAGTIAQGKVDALKGAENDEAGTATVYGALATAAAADAKAEQNKTDIASINTVIGKLNETYATDAEVEGIRSTLQGNIDAKVAKADYDVKVKALEDADTALDGRVDTLESDVSELKTASATHATKTELSEAVAALKSNGADDADSETIAGAKAYADAAIDTFYNTYIENDSTALDTLKDVTEWLDANKDGAADIVADITNLTNNKVNVSDFNDFKTGDFKNVADKAHEHANKALLDTYTQTEANLADAVAKKHSHAEDMVEVTPAMKEAWDKVSEKATQSDLSAHTSNKENPHEVTAAQVGAYTTAEADAKFALLSAFESDKATVKEATHAASATNAVNAEKATADADGNNIADTYETKTNVAAVETRVKALEDANEFIIDCGSSTVNVFDFPAKG